MGTKYVLRTKTVYIVLLPESSNVKTGDIPQVYFIPRKLVQSYRNHNRQGLRPFRNHRFLYSACPRSCAYRRRNCYVIAKARQCSGLLAMVRSLAKGNYKPFFLAAKNPKVSAARIIRVGAFGDPSSLGFRQEIFWKYLRRLFPNKVFLSYSASRTYLDKHNMVSLKNPSFRQLKRYHDKGYRCFVSISRDYFLPFLSSVVKFFPFKLCRHASEGIKCKDCRLCNGSINGNRLHIWEFEH